MEARALFTAPWIAELIVAQRSLKITYSMPATNTDVRTWLEHQEQNCGYSESLRAKQYLQFIVSSLIFSGIEWNFPHRKLDMNV